MTIETPSNDNVDMELLVKEDGLWLHRPNSRPQLINLGDPERVFQLLWTRWQRPTSEMNS